MADIGSFHSTQDLLFPDWQPQYRAALLETDPQKLPERVLELEEAIVERMRTIADAPNGEAEKIALEDVIRALRVLQVEKLKYPYWQKE